MPDRNSIIVKSGIVVGSTLWAFLLLDYFDVLTRSRDELYSPPGRCISAVRLFLHLLEGGAAAATIYVLFAQVLADER